MSDEKPSRCSGQKHVKERGEPFCDCGILMVGLTAAKNAVVITVLDPLQFQTLTKIAEAS